MTFPAGTKIRASDLNRLGTLVARNRRTTNSTLVTTITRVLSCSGPVIAGRSYRVTAHGACFGNSGASAVQCEIRYTTTGVEPTVTSTVLAQHNMTLPSTTGVPEQATIIGMFDAVASGTLFVCVTIFRVSGAVTVAWAATAASPMHLTIEDVGVTVATTGTVY